MKIFITALILPLLCLFLLSSCGDMANQPDETYKTDLPDQPDQPDKPVGLSNIITVTKPLQSEDSDDYLFLSIRPDFHPDTLVYTVDVDSTYIFGFKPVLVSSNTSMMVHIDSNAVKSDKWNEIDKYYTCRCEDDNSEKTVEIIVSGESGKTESVYTLFVEFNHAGETYRPKCLLDSLPLVSWATFAQEIIYVGRGAISGDKLTRKGFKNLTPIPSFSPAVFNYTVSAGSWNYFGIDRSNYEFSIYVESDLVVDEYDFPQGSFPNGAYCRYIERTSASGDTSTIKVKYFPQSCDTQVYTITVIP